jgi:predicted nucleotidyltransferase
MERNRLHVILRTLRSELDALLGEQIVKVILYGSQARGEGRDDSDIDVLVVLNGDFSYGEMLRRTSQAVARISLDHDVVISRAFASRADYEHSQMPFLMNVRREGIVV